MNVNVLLKGGVPRQGALAFNLLSHARHSGHLRFRLLVACEHMNPFDLLCNVSVITSAGRNKQPLWFLNIKNDKRESPKLHMKILLTTAQTDFEPLTWPCHGSPAPRLMLSKPPCHTSEHVY